MDFGINGKIAIVTGGATGIGYAIAKTFHDEGAVVVINGRDQAKLDKACASIGPRAHGVVADLMAAEGATRLSDFAGKLGPVSFLVNNIGVFDVNDFFEVSDERWMEYFQHNLMTAIRISRIVMKDMLARNDGSIVFISSEAAIRSIGNMVPYSTTKTAMLGLSRSLAELTRGTNVRVNSYMPGSTATESVETYFADLAVQQGKTVEQALADFYRDVQPSNLTQKLIDPAMHGRGVVQLMTNQAMNGLCHRADGGTIRSIFG
ncbi:SDR family NAD(P)-dependent oxidoreductase [Ensifer sp. ENS11]|jgi:NAD(P)-dependent dehydrogenase (short-subunit alcohol dehydrogenase family)|uniref:SDR family NAD(P)-dependent oxidoreductase n=1 Tax=Ensifer sp. ENS11 TaxID=2769291 RepID=UPI00042EC639|nr:SDR family oxidoreductase [Ensifer sp. ENS11]AHK47423.1 3-oxoacyl-(acyl-carrier-protein) reductase NodG [Ensifer adhaerens OV14]MBD9490427.1 SDR family oxidoreductase [Ensifer sp. ENS11]MDP9632948.1 NAD(P)-dependent dehydrogenase (short-subunit alcohol dehydrogenase family) [Ensifer adhaerens]